jgi:hypothetical protein
VRASEAASGIQTSASTTPRSSSGTNPVGTLVKVQTISTKQPAKAASVKAMIPGWTRKRTNRP